MVHHITSSRRTREPTWLVWGRPPTAFLIKLRYTDWKLQASGLFRAPVRLHIWAAMLALFDVRDFIISSNSVWFYERPNNVVLIYTIIAFSSRVFIFGLLSFCANLSFSTSFPKSISDMLSAAVEWWTWDGKRAWLRVVCSLGKLKTCCPIFYVQARTRWNWWLAKVVRAYVVINRYAISTTTIMEASVSQSVALLIIYLDSECRFEILISS